MSVKQELLTLLEEHKGEYISGAGIAQQLGVSRNAVWKAITALKEDGYEITSSKASGYALSTKTDILSDAGIRAYTDVPVLYVFDEIDSTNEEAKRIAIDGAPHGAFVVANHQTKGKGRRGRVFYSPSNTGVYMSLLLRLDLEFSESVLITTAASVAVARAIDRVCGTHCSIKWVNDIYLNDRKICGILSEAVTDMESGRIDSIVVGIGINVSTDSKEFPEEFRQRASSIYAGRTSESVRNHLAAAVYEEMMAVADALPDRGFLKEYESRSNVIGRDIRFSVKDGWMDAKAISIDENGGLVVETPDGKRQTLSTGEISIRTRE